MLELPEHAIGQVQEKVVVREAVAVQEATVSDEVREDVVVNGVRREDAVEAPRRWFHASRQPGPGGHQSNEAWRARPWCSEPLNPHQPQRLGQAPHHNHDSFDREQLVDAYEIPEHSCDGQVREHIVAQEAVLSTSGIRCHEGFFRAAFRARCNCRFRASVCVAAKLQIQ